MTGCMGVSEIEAIGVGVTTIMALDERWYDGSHETTRDVPVLGGPVARADFVDAIVDGVGRAMDGARITGGRAWVDANHSPGEPWPASPSASPASGTPPPDPATAQWAPSPRPSPPGGSAA